MSEPRINPNGALKGKNALVTGASRGIGEAIAARLAMEGANVVVSARTAESGESRLSGTLHETVERIRRAGGQASFIKADLAQAAERERLVQEAAAAYGPIDILVNNAGIARPQPIEEITERDWDDLIDANLKSCFLVTQAVLPGMRARQWGRIVNLSSVAAQVGGVVGPHYAASKAGILGLTRYYARHLAKEGIRVNAIAPALIETEMVTSNPNAQPSHIPVGRFGHVDEVAQVAVMLARNGYITGQTINVNGGWFMS